jgi:AcrR family transcriptional regulator
MTEAARPARPYHHGDLRAALLASAETILERDGIQALTLRAAARDAGVSHAAPMNHFGDLTGLLSDLAAVGYARFAAALTGAMEAAGANSTERMLAMGRAYVAFARAHPGLFVLMFRSERLDFRRPALCEAADLARRSLRDSIIAHTRGPALSPVEVTVRAAAMWSLVHGFATLLLDGRLDGMVAVLPGEADPAHLLEQVLSIARVGEGF